MNTTNQQEERYYAPPSTSPIKAWLMLLASIIIIGFFVAVFILARTMLATLAPVFVLVFMGVVMIALVGAVSMGIYHWYSHVENKKQQAHLVRPNPNNTYPAMWIESEKRFVQPVNGQLPNVSPQTLTYSPQNHNHNDPKELYKIMELTRSDLARLEIEAPGEKPVPTARQLLQDGTVKKTIEGGEIILGFLEDGSMKTLAYDLLYSTDLGGVGGSGKTTTAYWLCVQEIIAGTRLIVVDPHLHVKRRGLAQGLGQMLAPYQHAYHFAPCDDTPEKVIARARWMRDENKRRQGQGVDLDAEQQVMMVIDEFNSIIEIAEIRDELGDIIATVQREGRKLGLFFLLVGHRWSQQDIGNIKIRTNAATVMAHYYNDADQAGKLLGGQGKLCQTLKSGSYWLRGLMTGDLMKVSTPMIDERDTALILDVMGKPTIYPTGKTIESVVESARESVDSPTTENVQSISSSDGRHTTPVVEPMDRTLPFDLEKFRQARILILARETQNKIICEVWQVQENTRQFRAAKEEFQLMLAYLASMASVEEE